MDLMWFSRNGFYSRVDIILKCLVNDFVYRLWIKYDSILKIKKVDSNVVWFKNMVKRYMNMSIMIVFKIIRQYPSPPDTVIQMIWDERPLGPVWTYIQALGRVFGRFCLLGAYACGMMIIEIQIWDKDKYWDTDGTYEI